VGNENGSFNILNITEAKAVQTIALETSEISAILELDEITILVVSKLGEMNLVYLSDA